MRSSSLQFSRRSSEARDLLRTLKVQTNLSPRILCDQVKAGSQPELCDILHSLSVKNFSCGLSKSPSLLQRQGGCLVRQSADITGRINGRYMGCNTVQYSYTASVGAAREARGLPPLFWDHRFLHILFQLLPQHHLITAQH
ncbi:hypothetical protein J6590_081965 [Homalodisca vitripennis]|nr:hypothetical protein J6590_081965 [Homalodisca vitripennis]